MRAGWRDRYLNPLNPTRRCILRNLLSSVALPSITLALLVTNVLAAGSARDRGKRSQQVERIATADPRVIVSACTLSGSFTIRGWDRKEVRVRSDGADIDLVRIDQTMSEPATELKVVSKGSRSTARNSC